ncbi:hypothetical protein LG293_17115 (plasmid) [Citricoccus nitrophenolicus]
MNKNPFRLSAALVGALLLTGCAAEIRDESAPAPAESSTPTPAQVKSSTTPASEEPSPSPVLLTEAETCQELAGGEGSLAYRAATWAKALKDSGAVDNAVYAEARKITEDAEALSEVASWNTMDEVEAVASGPQQLVDAVKNGNESISTTIPGETLSTVTEGATSCLTGQDKDDFAAFMYEIVVGEPMSGS